MSGQTERAALETMLFCMADLVEDLERLASLVDPEVAKQLVEPHQSNALRIRRAIQELFLKRKWESSVHEDDRKAASGGIAALIGQEAV